MSARRLVPDSALSADEAKAADPRKKDGAAAVRGGKAHVERLFPDPRREMAQKAAKAHWADWASKKVT
jgi:hypothetical protein